MSQVKYIQIIPAVDWHFVHSGVRAGDPPTVWHIAAWGLTPEGEAVGLVGAFGKDQGKAGVAPKLVSVPPVAGAYLHRDQLNDIEREQLIKR